MTYTIFSTRSLFFACVVAMLVMAMFPVFADAKSTSWSKDAFDRYLYFSSSCMGCNEIYSEALMFQTVKIDYRVKVIRNDTGQVVPDGGSVPVGTRITLQFVPFDNRDITWFGNVWRQIGYDSDSPYGAWVSGLGSANIPGGECSGNLLGEGLRQLGSAKYYGDFIAKKPDRSITNLGGMSCGGLSGGEMECTVNAEKTFTPQFNFSSTDGRFWAQKKSGGCRTEKGDYNIGSRSITYTIKGTAPENKPPVTPNVSGSGACVVNTKYNFSIVATDPDGDTIRYGVDFNGDKKVDAWYPPSGYVASGTSRNGSYTWTTAGTKTMNVITQDSKGALSAWATHTVTCSNPPPGAPTVVLTAKPSSITKGASSDLEWSSTNATSCTGVGFNAGGRTAGSKSAGTHVAVSPQQTTTYQITCTGPGGTASDSATVAVTTPQEDGTGGGGGGGGGGGESIACPDGYIRNPSTLECERRGCFDVFFCVGNDLYRGYSSGQYQCQERFVRSCAYGCAVNACIDTPPAPEIILWQVAPTLGVKGYTTNIKWKAENVESCMVTGTNGSSWSGTESPEAGRQDTVQAETTYSLSCIGLDGETPVTRSTTVRLTPIHNED